MYIQIYTSQKEKLMIPKQLERDLTVILNDYLKHGNKDKARSDIKELLLSTAKTDRSLTVYYSYAKRVFKTKIQDQEFLKTIRPSERITSSVIQNNIKVRDSAKIVKIDREFIDKILEQKDSWNAHNLSIYLLFISGRRIGELLSSPMKLKKGRIFMNGKLKTRGKVSKTCLFDTIGNPKEFIKLLTKFRSMIGNRSTFTTVLNRRVKKLLGNQYHTHMIRGIYASYLFKFHNNEDEKINTFIKNVLNHESIESSISYTGYSITFDKRI